MSKYAGTIVTLIVTFVVTLTLNSISTYFSSTNGSMAISQPLSVGDSNIVVLSINNYSNKFIENMTLEIPGEISSKNFHSDTAVKFSDSVEGGNHGNGSVKISQISPRQITTIVISGIKSDARQSIRVLNASESGLTVQSGDELESPLRRAITMALFASVAQAILLSISTYYANAKFNETKEQIDDLKNKLDESGKNAGDLRKELRETKTYAAKIRILLLGRISDYSKELEFWRNVVKEMVVSGGTKKGDYDGIVNLVRRTLKTYSTKDSELEFEAIKIAAEWLRSEERNFAQE